MPPLSPLWLPLPNSTQVVGLLPLVVRALPLVLLQVAGALPLVLLQVAGALPLVLLRLSRGRRVVEAPFFGVLAAACTLGGPTAAASWTPPDLLPALLSELLVLLDELLELLEALGSRGGTMRFAFCASVNFLTRSARSWAAQRRPRSSCHCFLFTA